MKVPRGRRGQPGTLPIVVVCLKGLGQGEAKRLLRQN